MFVYKFQGIIFIWIWIYGERVYLQHLTERLVVISIHQLVSPGYWWFHLHMLEEHLFLCVMWVCLVGFFLNRSQHPKHSSITKWENVLQNNFTILNFRTRCLWSRLGCCFITKIIDASTKVWGFSSYGLMIQNYNLR